MPRIVINQVFAVITVFCNVFSSDLCGVQVVGCPDMLKLECYLNWIHSEFESFFFALHYPGRFSGRAIQPNYIFSCFMFSSCHIFPLNIFKHICKFYVKIWDRNILCVLNNVFMKISFSFVISLLCGAFLNI